MLKLFFTVFFVFSLFSNANEPLVIGERIIINSKLLNEDRSIHVYLPRTYQRNETQTYDVLYVLDGNANLLHAAGSQLFLAGYRQMPELIIVGINNTNRNRDLTPSVVKGVPESGGADKFRQFIKNELIPHIESNYRTNKKRYLSGHSYGGLFAIDTLVKQPKLFNAYFTFSPSLRWDNNLVLNALIKKLKQTKVTSYLYVNIGDEGYKLKNPILQLQEFLKSHDDNNLNWHVDWLDQENHSTTPVIGQFLAFRNYFSR